MVKACLIQVTISVINEIKDLCMKTLKPVVHLLIASAIFVSSAGCDLVGMAIEEAIDCAFRMSAQLDGKTLPNGKVGELYDERLVASVNNTPTSPPLFLASVARARLVTTLLPRASRQMKSTSIK